MAHRSTVVGWLVTLATADVEWRWYLQRAMHANFAMCITGHFTIL